MFYVHVNEAAYSFQFDVCACVCTIIKKLMPCANSMCYGAFSK